MTFFFIISGPDCLDWMRRLISIVAVCACQLTPYAGYRSFSVYREDFKGYVQPYTPRFYNGWQPSPQVIDEINRPGPSGSAANRSFRQEEYRPVSYNLGRGL